MINIKLLTTISIHSSANEMIQTYQVKAVILIWHQVLTTNLQGNVQQLEGRINNQILGVDGLKEQFLVLTCCCALYVHVINLL